MDCDDDDIKKREKRKSSTYNLDLYILFLSVEEAPGSYRLPPNFVQDTQ